MFSGRNCLSQANTGSTKRSISAPFRTAEFDILYGKGISQEGSVLDMGVEKGIVTKSGSWFTYQGQQLGQGKENARSFLESHKELTSQIEEEIKASFEVSQ